VLVTSMGKRETPLTIAITTAGVGRTGIAWELYDYAKRIQAGEVEDPTPRSDNASVSWPMR
jgi:phage terminase large subunit-like protein